MSLNVDDLIASERMRADRAERERDRYREALERLTKAVRWHIEDGGYDGTFEELAEVLAAAGGDPE